MRQSLVVDKTIYLEFGIRCVEQGVSNTEERIAPHVEMLLKMYSEGLFGNLKSIMAKQPQREKKRTNICRDVKQEAAKIAWRAEIIDSPKNVVRLAEHLMKMYIDGKIDDLVTKYLKK